MYGSQKREKKETIKNNRLISLLPSKTSFSQTFFSIQNAAHTGGIFLFFSNDNRQITLNPSKKRVFPVNEKWYLTKGPFADKISLNYFS